jgi:hypothetical protein
MGAVTGFLLIPFLSAQATPLSLGKTSFRTLLADDRFVYFENFRNVSSSPLQMTADDRELMLSIGRQEGTCLDANLSQVAVIGTDHEVSWFQIYTKIYPSLFQREDGYIDFLNYQKNFDLWRKSSANEYIVVLSHFDYWQRTDILNEIRSIASPVCIGKSIAIYKKN